MYDQNMRLGDIAVQVWREFTPRGDEGLVYREDGIIEVTIAGSSEGFDIDPDQPPGQLAASLADRIQTVVMEGRQEMTPDCPLHPGAHPLEASVVNDAAAWVCPKGNTFIRYMMVSPVSTT